MKKLIKNIDIKVILFCMIWLVFTSNTFANTQIIDPEDIPQSKAEIRYTQNLLVNKKLLASSKFDLRNLIEIEIKNQKSTQECWAFASNEVIETNLLLRHGEKYDFSERHMAYATSKTFTDGINQHGHNKEVAVGGNGNIAMAYYTSGRGPILEEEMPFSENEQKISLQEIENKTVQKKIADYEIFPSILKNKDSEGNIKYSDANGKTNYTELDVYTIRNMIKEHIIEYGAVISMTVTGSALNSYYNYALEYPAYYCDNKEYFPNHQIAIIGWDDNYSIENFNSKNRPSKPGAYLILNSYGTDQFKKGCYYISYEDYYIEYGIMGVKTIEDIDYKNIYQYDELGLSSAIAIGDNQTVYGANVFERKEINNEILQEIGITAVSNQEFDIFVNPTDGELDLEKMQYVETNINTMKNGYVTAKLKNPIELSGEKFAIVVRYKEKNNKKALIGIETRNTEFWMTATSNPGESYYSIDGTTWSDITEVESMKNANICIKAFTNMSTSEVTSQVYEVEANYISNVECNTTTKEFIENIETQEGIKILKNNIELSQDDIITTGTIIKTNNNKIYNIIVRGDITKTGTITNLDISKFIRHLIDIEHLKDLEIKAADMNNTGNISLTDLSQMKVTLWK